MPSPRLPMLADLAPSWRVIDLSSQIGKPFGDGYWAFNPSIHYSTVDRRWRCAVRVANYSIPDGTVIAPRGATMSHVLLCELDPTSWTVECAQPLRTPRSIEARDYLTRAPHCASLGLEDLRLFDVADHGGRGEIIFGIACALEYNTKRPGTPEQVLVEIDRVTNEIMGTVPLRGAWSHRAQKNWAPFDGETCVRLLYDIERGTVLRVNRQSARADLDNPAIATTSHGIPIGAWWRATPENLEADLGARSRQAMLDDQCGHANTYQRGVEVKTMRRPVPAPRAQEVVRVRKPGSDNLRGGSQLVPLDGDDRWIGIAHEMTINATDKWYWQTFYTCDRNGTMLERSAPLKLFDTRIEFAAGLQIAPGAGEIAVSFGVDDHEAKIGVASLAEIVALLRPIERSVERVADRSTAQAAEQTSRTRA